MTEGKLSDNQLEFEKLIIAGILKYPDIFFDLELIIKPEDFSKKVHQCFWTISRDILNRGEKLDYRILTLKINELQLDFKRDLGALSVGEYAESLFYISVSQDSIRPYAAELKKLSGKKALAQAALDAYSEIVESSSDLTYTELVNLFDQTINNKVNMFESGNIINQPVDLFRGLREEIEDQGNEQIQSGVICPHKILRAKFGDFYPGDVYVFASRMKSGKSLFLMNILHMCCNSLDQDAVGLIIDTELTTKEVRWRLMSMLTGINENHFRKGTWRNNKEWMDAVRKIWPIIEMFFDRTQHLYVGNAPIEQVGSIIRRWHKRNIPEGSSKQALIIYDYIKINADLISNRYKGVAGHDLAGYKCDYIKKLAAELQCPIITSVQTNRSNASKKADDRMDDTAVISMSDQIGMYISNMYLFNSLTLEEMQDLKINYGLEASHRLIPLVTRRQGDEAPGFTGNYVKIQDGEKVKYVENCIYYLFDSFKVTELADLASLVKDRAEYNLKNEQPAESDDEGEML